MSERRMNDLTFEAMISEGKLAGAKCQTCGDKTLPPRGVCPACGSSDLEWYESPGSGTLVAFTIINIGPPWMVERGFDRSHPYCSGVVQLDDGSRVVARIEGLSVDQPTDIKIGTPVQWVPQPGDTQLVFAVA